MLIQESFAVPRSVDEVWAFLLDVERVAPCMPGARLTEVIDDSHWNGLVDVRLGPISMTFRGSVAMDERDDGAHRVRLTAKGMEQRGKGAANATVTTSLTATAEGTIVSIDADITLSGAAAQLSRGLVPEVAKQLTARFADCLRSSLEEARPAPTATPVRGTRLGLAALWAAATRWLRGLFHRGTDRRA